MRSVADLNQNLATATAQLEQLRACFDALEVAEALAPVPALKVLIAESARAACARLAFAQRRVTGLHVALTSVRLAARCYAEAMVVAARSVRSTESLESTLLSLLGSAAVELDTLTEVEHAYVVAALQARVAVGKGTRARAIDRLQTTREALRADSRRAA